MQAPPLTFENCVGERRGLGNGFGYGVCGSTGEHGNSQKSCADNTQGKDRLAEASRQGRERFGGLR